MAIDPTRAVFYGQCVEVVYKMYESAPNNATPAPSWALPAGYKFVAWVQMRDFTPIGPGPYTFYGLIASSPSDPNKYVLAIRGTEDLIEWFDDLTSIVLVPMPAFGQVGDGFYTIYQTLRVVYPPLGGALGVESLEPAGSFADQVVAATRRHSAQADKSAQIEVTGHSLGAALATIYVAENSHGPNATIPLICTFASPRVGDHDFASKFDQLGITSWRIVNQPDIVPTLPFLGFWHVGTEYLYNSASSTVWSLPCFHALETYLHLLDPNQPLQKQCIWPPTAIAPSRAQTRLMPAASAENTQTQPRQGP
jgi:Lipase (class 3)